MGWLPGAVSWLAGGGQGTPTPARSTDRNLKTDNLILRGADSCEAVLLGDLAHGVGTLESSWLREQMSRHVDN